MKLIKKTFIVITKGIVKIFKNQQFWIIVLTLTTFISALYFLIPNTKRISAPAIVAASDGGKLIPLKILINNNHDLTLRFDFYDLLYLKWNRAAVQKTDKWENVKLVINGKSSETLDKSVLDSVFIDEGDNYFHFEKKKLEKYFDFSKTNEFYVEYIFKNGFYPRNYSSSFISLLYIPVDYNQKTDSLLSQETEISLETPHNYIVTSSIPDADKIFVLEEGVNYSFKYKRKETGIFITLENISATGLKEVIMLLITTVFSFALGLLIEKWIQERKVGRKKND